MKRVRCPKCDSYITFDETKYKAGQALVFQCPACNKQFGIRLGAAAVKNTQDEQDTDQEEAEAKKDYGCIVLIESPYHYKQVVPLHYGVNVIGRYMKTNNINCPIETGDLNIDYNHCSITISKDKKGRLKYVLKDGPSYNGTFIKNERLGDKEQRVIYDNDLVNIGISSFILHTKDHIDE